MEVILLLVAAGALALAVLLAVSSLKPDEVRIERSLFIDAKPEQVFLTLQGLRGWNFIEAYRRHDPGIVFTYGDSVVGVGAALDWNGEDMGTGRLTIVEADPPRRVVMRLDLFSQRAAINIVTFEIDPSQAGARVRCTIAFTSNLITKVSDTLDRADKWMGEDIDIALARLKATVEQAARLPAIPVPLIVGGR